MKRIVAAFDPGTSAKGCGSALGFCLYDPNTDTILLTAEIWADAQKPTWGRLRNIVSKAKEYMIQAEKKYGPLEVRVERFIMRALSGETLARLVGGIIANIPTGSTFLECHNIRLKKDLTGNSSADKILIGLTLMKRFPAQAAMIKDLIDSEQRDALDAIAIAICTVPETER